MRTLALSLLLLAVACASPSAGQPGAKAGMGAAAPAGARVARVWHGRTPTARADEYAAYASEAIRKFRQIPGNLGYAMYREDGPSESHFMVVSYWASRDAIHAYAGEDISRTRALPRDAEFLIDPEPTVHNYDIVVADQAP
ncbi:antibiotic biosynthesis monooxygenase family protein [Anaeromyxobacter terrae]|uniref:antibiotic biosynthesis monooxygenase family protein n=1 Tax=Anaeromyxobacter terrae TaxID=2925406 RepID=UPI001F56BA8C|nr:antibiotic biosynthesis monooxygenase [Anaeromyxobacter sp. SG22]